MQTPLLDRHRSAGARLIPLAGYDMPVQYEGIRAEHVAVRTASGRIWTRFVEPNASRTALTAATFGWTGSDVVAVEVMAVIIADFRVVLLSARRARAETVEP